jgi:hypothetical protein
MMNKSSFSPVVVLQLDIGVCLAVILDDVVQFSEVFWEPCVTHLASECLWPRSLMTEDASLPVITSTPTWLRRMVFGLCILVPPAGLMVRLGFRMAQPDMGRNTGH